MTSVHPSADLVIEHPVLRPLLVSDAAAALEPYGHDAVAPPAHHPSQLD